MIATKEDARATQSCFSILLDFGSNECSLVQEDLDKTKSFRGINSCFKCEKVTSVKVMAILNNNTWLKDDFPFLVPL